MSESVNYSNMDDLLKHLSAEDIQRYEAFKTELSLCESGGLFVGLYEDWQVVEQIIMQLQNDMPEQFHFSLQMHDKKTNFPVFFDHTFEQIGENSDIFHVIQIDDLEDKALENFIKQLQYNRERFKSKRYSIVFWLKPATEKLLFDKAPDFHHWIFGVYDFTQWEWFENLATEPLSDEDLIHGVEQYLTKLVWQYKNWKAVKRSDDGFLNEVMSRADLYNYYIEQYCIDDEQQVVSLNKLLSDFLDDDSKGFLSLLGDFGTGKSSFSLHYFIQLAEAWLADKTAQIPLFISLKNYPKRLNIYRIIQQEFYSLFKIPFSLSTFQKFALEGGFVFFVDGFDEMISMADEKETIINFKELTKLSFENLQFMLQTQESKASSNKIFLTCRSHYFLTEVQEQEILTKDYTVLYRNYATRSKYQIARIRLKEFSKEQIEKYIRKSTCDEENAKELIEIIQSTYNLEELSTRPLLLDMIIKSIPSLDKSTQINAAKLYKAYTSIWIEREDWRSCLTATGKRCLMWELSAKMYIKGGDFTLHHSALSAKKDEYLKAGYSDERLDNYLKYDVTTCTFLNRDSGGNYRFIHKSFMEYFYAEYFLECCLKNTREQVIHYNTLNKETQFFFMQLLDKHLNLQKSDLSEISIEGINLSYSNLEEAKLIKTTFKDVVLDNANLSKANLFKAEFFDTSMLDANFIDTQAAWTSFTKSSFNHATVTRTIFLGASFRNVTFINTQALSSNFTRAEMIDCDLNSAKLFNCILEKSIFKSCNFDGSQISINRFLNSNFLKPKAFEAHYPSKGNIFYQTK